MSSSQQLSVEREPVGRRLADPLRGAAGQFAPDGRRWRAETVTWLLLAALAGAVLDQGGFHTGAQRVLGAGLGAAVVVALWSVAAPARPAEPALGRWTLPAVAGFACACWAFSDGWLHGAPASGARPALLVIAVGTVIALCRWLSPDQRARLGAGIGLLGCLTALLGWYGVASHATAFALTGQGLWRAMGTLGYPNATAAFLGLVLVDTTCRQVRHASAHWPTALAATALLVGLGATLSRGGLIALVAGLAVLAALLGVRRLLGALWGPALGAALALAGLLPGLASTATPRPVLAAATLVAGLATGAGAASALRQLRSRITLAALAFLGSLSVLLAGAGAVLAGAGAGSVLPTLRQARFTWSSADRLAAWQAVTGIVARHPLTGAGPGLRTFSWADPHGGVLVFAYAHDEYLQVLAELGAIGLALLLAGLAAVLRVLLRYRPRSAGGEASAAAIAGLAVLCTSAVFDFTWHFPAIVLTAAALVGCAEPVVRLRDSSTSNL